MICTAKEFATGIRGHWGIENCLHWVKDVVFKEDNSTIRMGNASANLSILRAIALNILRRNGHTSITIAQRFISHDIDKLLHLMKVKQPWGRRCVNKSGNCKGALAFLRLMIF
ncbi:ISAs1 family transposase [Nostocaceae cyanobacterium CENA357]|uniref:ISAs1 family transposase n=1 Tax=Atlanticothrix silvestris CENA357 TaxID=1725252 RepID=A0A8J7L2V7_9CYAN|nr:ISAs1 family transposase [Atlanticothrix silvestris]MBH8552107.1 ISAs1 family transposase [Atlanticothrix silvestris CENA357]